MKLYFNKLGKAVVFTLIVLLFQALTSNIIFTLTGLAIKNESIKSLLIILIPIIIMTIITHKRRINNYPKKLKYFDIMKDEKFSTRSDISDIFKSCEFKMEIIAFSTLMLPLFFSLLSGLEIKFVFKFILCLITICVFIFIYLIVDLSSWHMVHKVWITQRIINSNNKEEPSI